MEGRTKFNYGKQDYILRMNDLKYMLNIVDSDLSDQDKATKLYAFCNYHTLLNNRKNYDMFITEDEKSMTFLVDIITKLITIYEEYDKKGYFDLSRNPYKCTLEEIELRLIKINLVFEIINADDKDYNKVEQLLSLFKSAEEFRKSYALFNKFGKKDERLISAREALDNFDLLYAKFKEYETKGIVDNVRYVLSINDYLQNYEYAKFIIDHYIQSSESYKEIEFLQELGLDKDTFNFCIQTIEELDVNLYKQFLEKKEVNKKIRCIKNAETITSLANGINKGVLTDGTPFDLLEFTKKIPFKRSNNFTVTLMDFMKRNNPQEFNTIMNYIYNNGLNTPTAFAPLDLKTIYKIKTTVNGVEITNADNNIIIDYLRVNNIPLIHKTYILAREKYLNGEITAEMVQTQKKQLELNKGQAKILIPSKN